MLAKPKKPAAAEALADRPVNTLTKEVSLFSTDIFGKEIGIKAKLDCNDGPGGSCKVAMTLVVVGIKNTLKSYTFPTFNYEYTYELAEEIAVELTFPIGGFGISLKCGIAFDASATLFLNLKASATYAYAYTSIETKMTISAFAEIDFGSILKAGVVFIGTLLDAKVEMYAYIFSLPSAPEPLLMKT